MKATTLAITVAAFLLSSLTAYAKPNYVQAPPLTQVVTTRVGEVADGITQVPIITWGGDIATILANGNAKDTGPGSIFGKVGLKLKLVREDVFTNQVERYLSGESPYLRGTMGMMNMAAEVISKDERTKPVFLYQLTWSAGGDVMVVKGNIKTPKDLKGKTIALQAYGPHVDYLAKVLADAGLTLRDVKIKWTKDLTASGESPAAALQTDPSVDAAFVISPDAMALTSQGTVGTGAENSVKGARILLSTKTANHIIVDVYAVRSDYFASHRSEVDKFTHGLMVAQEQLDALMRSKKKPEYTAMLVASAQLLLDSKEATADVEGLYLDCEFVGYTGNVKFFDDAKYARNFDRLNKEIQTAFMTIGLMGKKVPLAIAKFDYAKLKQGLVETVAVEESNFQPKQVAAVVNQMKAQGTLDKSELFSFEINFKPNQAGFSADNYRDKFESVIDKASAYGGAVITVEGHSDPNEYLGKKKAGESEIVLDRIKQGALNLSLKRSMAVRDSILGYAKQKGLSLDVNQFTVIGHGIMEPRTGICGADPCAPKTEQEWLSNMRVVFRIIQVEAEQSVFKPVE